MKKLEKFEKFVVRKINRKVLIDKTLTIFMANLGLDVSKAITLTTTGTSEAVTIIVDRLTIGDSTSVLLSGQTSILVTEDFINNGIVRYTSCTSHAIINFLQTGDMTFKSNNAEFCNLVIDKSDGGITVSDTLNISGNITVLNGDFANSASLTTGTMIVNDTWNLNGPACICQNLTITEKGSLNAQGHAISIAGNWTTAGDFIPDNNIVIFNGLSEQNLSIYGASRQLTFASLKLNCSYLNLQAPLFVEHDLQVLSGTLDANGHDIFTSGNWKNEDHFFHSESDVYLNAASGEHTLRQTDSFYNMTIGVTGGRTTIRLLSSVTIENQLNILPHNISLINN